MKYLGDSFDIHCGGEDLIFPHHENENAQSESVTGQPLAKMWVHNGFLKIDGEKMSKSLGNFWITRDILAKYPAPVVRLFLLSAHYRSPLDFSESNLNNTKKAYDEIHSALEPIGDLLRHYPEAIMENNPDVSLLLNSISADREHFDKYLDNDFNTAGALGQFFILLNRLTDFIAKRRSNFSQQDYQVFRKMVEQLMDMFSILGIVIHVNQRQEEDINDLRELETARGQKNWIKADEIKKRFLAKNYRVRDYGKYSGVSGPAVPAGKEKMTAQEYFGELFKRMGISNASK
jgi:cysteinyl-tRNA synthetase